MSYRIVKLTALIFFLTPFLSACSYFSEGLFIDEDRYAETISTDLFDDNIDYIKYLDQNWDGQDSLWFYTTTQGSTMMPYDIFINLEQADSEELFRSADNMNRYRYLVQSASFSNPDALPVGFVKDKYQDVEYIGLTCAACHTTQLNYQHTGIRIDGGPAMADMEGMLLALEEALKSSLEDDAKFNRLAARVLDKNNDRNKQKFQRRLQTVYADQKFYNESNKPSHGSQLAHYGYARLDAFGRIYNRILSHLTPGDQSNYNPANAPVSYPFLWDTPHSDFVQWNGVGDNRDEGLAGVLGPLGRNTGEVLGVFATFSLKRDGKKIGYQSSVNKHNLERLEQHLQKLESPQWPEDILPKIDRALAKQGREVYREYRCGWCHSGSDNVFSSDEFERKEDDRVMVAQFATLPWIGTDKFMVENALTYQGKTGLFRDKVIEIGKKEKFGDESLVLPALTKAAQGVILAPDYDKWLIRRWLEQGFLFIKAFADNKIPPTQRHNDFKVVPKNNIDMLNAYKARSLNGIWATAPYLHNGSVPNLYQLFSPSCSDEEINLGKKCRSNQFTVGSREFDPVHVGQVMKPKSRYPDLFLFDSSKPSNSNRGHEYAAGNTPIIELDASGKPVIESDKLKSFTLPPISEEKRLALVEYLKTL